MSWAKSKCTIVVFENVNKSSIRIQSVIINEWNRENLREMIYAFQVAVNGETENARTTLRARVCVRERG